MILLLQPFALTTTNLLRLPQGQSPLRASPKTLIYISKGQVFGQDNQQTTHSPARPHINNTNCNSALEHKMIRHQSNTAINTIRHTNNKQSMHPLNKTYKITINTNHYPNGLCPTLKKHAVLHISSTLPAKKLHGFRSQLKNQTLQLTQVT